MKTVIYYTSNREESTFEQRVMDNIKKNCGGLPIISVSQKPVDFGLNLCVGDVGVSNYNMFRQMWIACKVATTKFVVCTEADCLYPPDYFTFEPSTDLCCRNSNLYVMGRSREFFWRKPEGATHAQIMNRRVLLYRLDELFEGQPNWNAGERNFPKERTGMEDIFSQFEYWQSENPVVQIKTGRAMRGYTHSERIDIHDVPYWGNGMALRRQMCG